MSSNPTFRKLLVTCGLLLGTALMLRGLLPCLSSDITGRSVEASVSTRADDVRGERSEFATRKIEDIEVGDRVVTGISHQMRELAISESGPLPAWDDGQIEPTQWRRVELTLNRDDGSQMAIVLLRPLQWLRDNRVASGRQVPLSLSEMRQEGLANIEDVSECPPIASGDGCVVTGTFASIVHDIVEIRLDSSSEPILCTPEHPFYHAGKQKFVAASQLCVGEMLAGIRGNPHVQAVTPVKGEFRVHNLEVRGDHVFRVAVQSVLVHNTSSFSQRPQSVFTLTDKPVNLSRPQGTFVTATDLTKPENLVQHFDANVPAHPSRPPGSLPAYLTEIDAPNSVLPDPTVPLTLDTPAGWIPPNAPNAKPVQAWQVTEDVMGRPILTPAGEIR